MIFNISLHYPNPSNLIGDGPEAPEVKILAEQLKSYLLKDKCVRLNKVKLVAGPYKTRDSAKYRNFRNSPYTKLVGKTSNLILRDVKTRGKVTVWEFYDPESKKKVYLFIHFNMTGHISVNPPFSSKGEPRTHIEFVFACSKNDGSTKEKVIYWEDPRQLGSLIWMTPSELKVKLSNIGPSILNKSITPNQFIKIMRRSKTKSIARALLDQNKISGVGNYLRAEGLYLAKIHPNTEVQKLKDDDLIRIQRALQIVASQVIKAGGSLNYRDLNGNYGKYKFKVYNVKNDPTVKTLSDNSRTIYYKPSVQTIKK